MLVEITGVRMRNRIRIVETMRGRQGHRIKEFRVNLACGHEIVVPFGRRPKQGRRLHCPICEDLSLPVEGSRC